MSADDSRALDEIRYAHARPFEEYLAFLTRWSDAWVREHGMRQPDSGFDEPFQL